MEYKMRVDTLDKDDILVKSEIIKDRDIIIKELAYILKESREYSVVYSESGLYDIVSYNLIYTKDGIITIRRKFELDLF